MYDIVNVKVLVYNLKNETTVSKEGQPLRFWKGIMKADQDKFLLNALIDDAEKVVQRFMNERLVRSNEMSTVLVIKNPGIQVTEDEAVESEESWV